MSTATTAGRGLAIAAGVAFAGGALSILLQNIMDVQHPANMLQHWTLQHTLAVLSVVGVILAGELAREAWQARRFGKWAGFWLVVLIGTVLVVYNSVGRQAESAGTTTLSVEDRNDQRAEAKKSLAEHQRMLDEELAEHAREAASGGCGKKCQGIEASIEVYKAAIAGDEAKVKSLGAPEPDAPKAETFAELVHMVFGVDKGRLKALLTLLEPFGWTFMFEFGSIVSWGYVGRREKPVRKETAELDQLRAKFFQPDNDPVAPQPSPPGNRRHTKQPSRPTGATITTLYPSNANNRRPSAVSKVAGWAWLFAHCKRNGCLDSQDAMANELQLNKGTVAHWVEDWEAEGRIVRSTVGRRKEIRLADVEQATA